jgi:antitoxin VapB
MASVIKTAKVFRNGGSQAIRLPKDFRVSDDEVLLKQDFEIITIFPKRPRKGSFLALLRKLGPVELAPREQPGWTDKRDDQALRRLLGASDEAPAGHEVHVRHQCGVRAGASSARFRAACRSR